jgi:hypothetical protein
MLRRDVSGMNAGDVGCCKFLLALSDVIAAIAFVQRDRDLGREVA